MFTSTSYFQIKLQRMLKNREFICKLSYDERTEPRNIPILTKIYALLNTYLRLYGLYSIDDLSTAGVM